MAAILSRPRCVNPIHTVDCSADLGLGNIQTRNSQHPREVLARHTLKKRRDS